MVLSNDVELAGLAYNVVPGGYKKGRRKPLTVSRPAARKITRTELGPFAGGLGQAVVAGNAATAGWEGATVGPAFAGAGVEPFPNAATFNDPGLLDVPGPAQRAYGVVAGTTAYIGIGRRIYQSVALGSGVWSALSVAADLGAGFVISGLAYWQDDLLIMLSSGQDIRKYNTATGAVTVWRTGEKAQKGAAYAGQLVYAPLAANNPEELRLSGTKWNGNAITHLRYLDAPILNIAHFNGMVAIATRKSLYFMGGQPYPGEPDDAAISGDSSRAPEWRGDPEPVMTHGVYAEGDDFTFLESYRGRLYTWLGGRVAEYDDSAEQGRWARMGPEGTACYGACVAGDWLVVAIAGRYGSNVALWGFDGTGWWTLAQRAANATGGTAWAPSDVTSGTLKAWFKADAGISVANGAAIPQWDDQSGNGRHATQATAADRPIYRTNRLNGLPGVEFVSSDSLVTALTASETDETVMAVVDMDSAATNPTLLGPSNTGGRALRVSAARTLDWSKFGVAVIDASAGLVPLDADTIVGGTLTGSTASESINGTVEAAAHAQTFTAALTSQIGAANASNFWDGDIHEIVVCTALSGADRERLEGYLAHKWGLTANLPASHPYKTEAPLTPVVTEAYVWPCPLAGAGDRDLLAFQDNATTYDLLRLRWRSAALHTYATAGSWVSPLIDGGDPSAEKAWREIRASFASPSVRGNSASVDTVSFPLEYSIDGGATWATVESVDASSGATRLFTRGQTFAAPPQSRLLQVRQRWSSVSDWAPVLTGVWIESEDAAEYALAEIAQAAYEAALDDEDRLRRRWEITLGAGDREVRRDGQLDAQTGRQKIASLWNAWESGGAVSFKDIDNDADPVTYSVRIVDIEERAPRPADAGRWGESVVTLTLEEV